MKHCINCGAPNVESAKFCNSCGSAMPPLVSNPQTSKLSNPSLTPGIKRAPTHAKPANSTGLGCLGIILIIAVVSYCSGNHGTTSSTVTDQQTDSSSGSSSSNDTAPTDTPDPTEKPKPTGTPESYEHQRQREKHEFYDAVDQSVTADKIAGNPSKYVGTAVELHCTVANVPQNGIINASCGDDETNIVLEYDDTSSVDSGQSVRVLGTVDDPQQGTNAMGGSMSFPTVKVEFME